MSDFHEEIDELSELIDRNDGETYEPDSISMVSAVQFIKEAREKAAMNRKHDDFETGDVIVWTMVDPDDFRKTEYTYAALRTSTGFWYTTAQKTVWEGSGESGSVVVGGRLRFAQMLKIMEHQDTKRVVLMRGGVEI